MEHIKHSNIQHTIYYFTKPPRSTNKLLQQWTDEEKNVLHFFLLVNCNIIGIKWFLLFFGIFLQQYMDAMDVQLQTFFSLFQNLIFTLFKFNFIYWCVFLWCSNAFLFIAVVASTVCSVIYWIWCLITVSFARSVDQKKFNEKEKKQTKNEEIIRKLFE